MATPQELIANWLAHQTRFSSTTVVVKTGWFFRDVEHIKFDPLVCEDNANSGLDRVVNLFSMEWKKSTSVRLTTGNARLNGRERVIPRETLKSFVEGSPLCGDLATLGIDRNPWSKTKRDKIPFVPIKATRPYIFVKDYNYEDLLVPGCSIIPNNKREWWIQQSLPILKRAEKMRLMGLFPDLRGNPCDSEVPTWSSGFDVYTGGRLSRDFEWSSKSAHNSLSALFGRHLSTNLRPDEGHLHTFDNLVKPLIERLVSDVDPKHEWDPIAWLIEKDAWTDAKKAMYTRTMDKEVAAWNEGRTVNMVRPFKTMVKKGEVYYTTSSLDDRQALSGEASRPRNICVPPEKNCGHGVYMQSLLWASIKKALPEFVHGFTKKDYTNWLKDRVNPDTYVVSLDGSAFDSTQHAPLMDIVENRFLSGILSYDKWSWMDRPESWIRAMLTSMRDSLTSNSTWLFTPAAPFLANAPQWDE